MAQTKKTGSSYDDFAASLKTGQIERFYIFHGEERYLLDSGLNELRKLLCPDGTDSFNYKRFDGKDLSVESLEDAVITLPVFAERTLIEIHDGDIFAKEDRKERYLEILSSLPDYVCVVIIFDAVPYKPDSRAKTDKEIISNAHVIEFTSQEQAKLTKWIFRHFEAVGKRIGKEDAEYLALITDGYMTTLDSEIEKVSAYSSDEIITRSDIDAVVTPSLDAVAYKLTDMLLDHKYGAALNILDELFRMREAPQKIMFSISLKMRQLLAARICCDNNLDKSALMDMCGIRYDFQARTLMDTARKTTLTKCRDAVLFCSETAYALNSASEPEARMIELVARLALMRA